MREPVTVDWTIIGDTKELNIHGSHLGPYTYPLAIDYIHSGAIDVSHIVTHQLPLENYLTAFEMQDLRSKLDLTKKLNGHP